MFDTRALSGCLATIMLTVMSLPDHLYPEENFFIQWGAVTHADKSACLHRPQDPHFPLPNQLTYVAYIKGNPGTIVTEQSPKWNIRDDKTIPGNGYYGVEVGNLPTAFARPANDLIVAMTCYGAGEQAVLTKTLPGSELAAHMGSIRLAGGALPDYPAGLDVIRTGAANEISWDRSGRLKYDIYRSDLTDTLADGRPRRLYQRVAAGVDANTFSDQDIISSHLYGYLLIAEEPAGARSGHSPESVDVPAAPGPLEHLAAFANGSVAVSYAGGKSVTILAADGATITSIETGPNRWFAIDVKDQLWVLTSAPLLELTNYSSSGSPKKSMALPGSSGPEGAILGIAVDKKRQLWILSQGGVRVYDRKLRSRGAIRFDTSVGYPTSLAVRGKRLAVVDAVGRQILFYSHSRKSINRTERISIAPLDPWGVAWLSDTELVISDPFNQSLSVFSTDGSMSGYFQAEVVGSFRAPRHISIRDRQIYTADGDRIVVLPVDPGVTSWQPVITFGAEGQATLTWDSAVPSKSEVRFWLEDGAVQVVTNQEVSEQHHVLLHNLPPVSRINYAISTPIRTIPPTRWTTPFDFATPLWEPGKTAILRLPLAVILHTQAVDQDRVPSGAPPLRPIAPSEIDRINKQVEAAVLFYWHNTRMKVFLDVDYFTIADYWDVAPFGEEPAPDASSVATYLESQGRQLSDYVGILRIIAEQQYNTETGKWQLSGRGGGFTWGINPLEKLPGKSWWRATPAYESSGNNWLVTHEFHHQLDAMFAESGHLEYPFNHFSPQEYSGPFGEHFDGNAYILRELPSTDWFLLRWGEPLVFDDLDEDGIPDDAPQLPTDEKRLGSSPLKQDSDGDGLADMDEVLLSNWITQGVGEDWGAPVHLPDLTSGDTDGDGLGDGQDPYPLHAFDPTVSRRTPTIDGVIDVDEWSSFYSVEGTTGKGDIFFGWDGDYFYGAVRMEPVGVFHLQLDANVDGWFDGRDNLIFRFTPDSTTDEISLNVSVFVCDEEPERYPYIDKELFPVEGVQVRSMRTNNGYVVEFAIPRNDELGLSLVAGEQFGVNAGIYFDAILDRRLSMFEPNRITIFNLGK